jgi:hypothetical protein
VVYKSYEVGNHFFGIRTNSHEAAAWLDATLGKYEVTDEEADPYYSLFIGQDEGVGQPYHIIYKEGSDLIRSLDAGAIAQRLMHDLEFLTLRGRDDAAYLGCCVVSRNGVRALVPADIVPYMRLSGRRVERALELPLDAAVAVELGTGRLFAVPPQLDIPADAALDLARRIGQTTAVQPGGDVPETVDVICDFEYDIDAPPVAEASRAVIVYGLSRFVINMPTVGQAGLDALSALVAGRECYVLQNATVDSTFEILRSVLDDAAERLQAAV